MNRIIVTGASGFVGRATVAALADRGYEVHGVARTPVDDIRAHAWHTANLLDPAEVSAVVRTAEASHLLHLAWTTAHGRYWSDPANLAWARATCSLAEAFIEAGGVRAVMSGSCAQYSWDSEAIGPSGIANETSTPRRPATLYGWAKQATAELLEAWSAQVGLSYATALVFFPYGPFEQPERLLPSVARSLLAGEAAEVSVGTQVRDFMHVEDCGAAIAALVDGGVTGAVNIGTGQGSSVADVARLIARLLEREDLLRLGARSATDEAPKIVADPTRLHNGVGVTPKYDLESGIRETIDWWSAHATKIAPG